MNTRIESVLSISIILGLLLVSKEFLIFNELAIVAICFFLFITYAANSFDKALQAEFDERKTVIAQEYNELSQKRQEIFNVALNVNKAQLNLRGDMTLIIQELHTALNAVISTKDTSFERTIKNRLIQKLLNLKAREVAFATQCQTRISSAAQANVTGIVTTPAFIESFDLISELDALPLTSTVETAKIETESDVVDFDDSYDYETELDTTR